MMERRTFLGMVASFLGVGRCAAPTRPMRSKPYMEEGRPEYEESVEVVCIGGPCDGETIVVSSLARTLAIPVAPQDGDRLTRGDFGVWVYTIKGRFAV